MPKVLKKFISPINIFVFAILAIALLIRVYRIGELLGFYFDQGRDALVIWDFWKNGKLFLIGPTTGIEGVFRGPWYYWLIAPFYILGDGNPVWPSVFLSATSVMGAFLAYKIADKLAGKWAGITALVISGFSLNLAAFAVYLFFKDKKKLPGVKTIAISLFFLGLTFAPQILFDLRHEGILRGTISKFLFQEGSFKLTFWEIAKIRFPFYYDVFFSKLFQSMANAKAIFAIIFGLLLFYKRKAIIKDKRFVLVAILLASPIVGMLFFQGNYGNVYDYYFTGYYLIFVVFFSSVFGLFSKYIWGKALILIFLALFLKDNLPIVRNYIVSGVDGPTTIAFGNQKQAVDWIYQDAGGREFNTDVYVPPVIPYAYDYLFKWYGSTHYAYVPKVEQISLLYTLYEVDPPHPERLTAWLKRQETIGKIEKEERYGGIIVQKRERYEIQN